MLYLEMRTWRSRRVALAPQLREHERLQCSDISLQITRLHCSTRKLWWVIQRSFWTWAFWKARTAVSRDKCPSYRENRLPRAVLTLWRWLQLGLDAGTETLVSRYLWVTGKPFRLSLQWKWVKVWRGRSSYYMSNFFSTYEIYINAKRFLRDSFRYKGIHNAWNGVIFLPCHTGRYPAWKAFLMIRTGPKRKGWGSSTGVPATQLPFGEQAPTTAHCSTSYNCAPVIKDQTQSFPIVHEDRGATASHDNRLWLYQRWITQKKSEP